jgi:hypothetical protein
MMTRTQRCFRLAMMIMKCKSCYEGTEFFKIIYMNFMIQRISYYISSPFGVQAVVPTFPVYTRACQCGSSSESVNRAACPSSYTTSCPSGPSVVVSYLISVWYCHIDFRFVPLSMRSVSLNKSSTRVALSKLITHRGRAFSGMNSLRSLEH